MKRRHRRPRVQYTCGKASAAGGEIGQAMKTDKRSDLNKSHEL